MDVLLRADSEVGRPASKVDVDPLDAPRWRFARNVSMTLGHLRDEISAVRELNRAWDRHVFRGVFRDFGHRA